MNGTPEGDVQEKTNYARASAATLIATMVAGCVGQFNFSTSSQSGVASLPRFASSGNLSLAATYRGSVAGLRRPVVSQWRADKDSGRAGWAKHNHHQRVQSTKRRLRDQ